MAATFATLGGLACTLPWLALALIAPAWVLRRHHNNGLCNPGGILQADGGRWRLLDDGGQPCLTQAQAEYVWHGPAWLVLRLQGVAPDGHACRRQATIWRASAGQRAWRQLHQRVALQLARTFTAGGAP